MIRLLPTLLVLSACAPVPPTDAPATVLIASGGIETDTAGRCFARTAPRTRVDIVDRVEQVAPARRDAAGTIIDPPVFRTVSEPTARTVGEGTRFEAVCPPVLTNEAFVQSLQRALLIRRAYDGPISGVYDPATRAAVQQLQRNGDLDSPVLSVATARDLGIFAQARP
ncbi:Putative peptidoglycan binding domain-containing protein [Loktanella sp. DSM 29012]|uniref:peptidoglycan-binding domain-containing protein n=1 Tax=Loktanella sp. DSM 29012 TaxID=1881056 RepID=UPI0008C969BF|nr:peptidoglycan-binding domain-containing protein [Loktanella sp. DSM 29012]SEP98702.1 Putative peptidoglycan binding domain-containing protein [Loktanella sp. DSM 29012]